MPRETHRAYLPVRPTVETDLRCHRLPPKRVLAIPKHQIKDNHEKRALRNRIHHEQTEDLQTTTTERAGDVRRP